MSCLVLATTSSVAGLEVLTASSAMAEDAGQGAGSDQSGQNSSQPDHQPRDGGLLGGLLGGNSAPVH